MAMDLKRNTDAEAEAEPEAEAAGGEHWRWMRREMQSGIAEVEAEEGEETW